MKIEARESKESKTVLGRHLTPGIWQQTNFDGKSFMVVQDEGDRLYLSTVDGSFLFPDKHSFQTTEFVKFKGELVFKG